MKEWFQLIQKLERTSGFHERASKKSTALLVDSLIF
jgi:hypothetical protein